jgi:hypothetical protein
VWPPAFRFSDYNSVSKSHLAHACYKDHSSPLLRYDWCNNIWWRAEIMKLLTVLCFPLTSYF